ncbi:hypothetical protein PRUPE_1G206400 [Prunus persica]|uniref:Uncharacterized protein n=1 Tax=Prunus persica TaxID=3760 RepID=A0A251R0P6_PRUPE|nr:hypothetical protein PRUPE_1G206400 [Prunus persica]
MQRGTALSNLEAESSLIVRLSAAMSCSSSKSVSASDSGSELELEGLSSGYFLFLLKSFEIVVKVQYVRTNRV